MTVQEMLRAIEADERLCRAEARGARAHENEESRTGREALERIARAELRLRAQPLMRVRGGGR